MTYINKCCNCYFDMYLLEINRTPKIMNPEKVEFSKYYPYKGYED